MEVDFETNDIGSDDFEIAPGNMEYSLDHGQNLRNVNKGKAINSSPNQWNNSGERKSRNGPRIPVDASKKIISSFVPKKATLGDFFTFENQGMPDISVVPTDITLDPTKHIAVKVINSVSAPVSSSDHAQLQVENNSSQWIDNQHSLGFGISGRPSTLLFLLLILII
ncbi:hypothetical protein GH714_003381 [Hevea brasiliensis]|uniref:Uncharacterized protein n=1 Tax=Hevea brasiliensis TaxID=3981 RepID=A0A6A6MAR2_HEVBR|nr:hypothetical protein GH714_003381 [Hevea brasiliensis]